MTACLPDTDTAAALNGWATCPHCRRGLYPRTARRSDAVSCVEKRLARQREAA